MKNIHTYNNIISVENLCQAWREFVRGKKTKKDVTEFSLNLSQHIFELHKDLENKTYQHGGYQAFNISDPKPRNIHKASVRDRLLHHAVYHILCPYFDRKFIYDSYSCRNFKGTHKAINRFQYFARKVSKNNRRTCWVLKCDIRKFFASINHSVLMEIIKMYISDQDIIWLIHEIVDSFYSKKRGIGLPLGNLTSQLLVNVYMNEFDQFVKYKLKIKYYIRYADDFVILSEDKTWLENLIPKIKTFLYDELKLNLHDDKIFIKTLTSGVDFLGWVNFWDHRVLRTNTKRRMMKRIKESSTQETISSYLGLLGHGNANKVKAKFLEQIF